MVKPRFPVKTLKEEIITLAKGGKIISEESELENIFSR